MARPNSQWLQCLGALSLVCLIVLNLFTLHYVINQNANYHDVENLRTDDKRTFKVRTSDEVETLPENMKIPRIVHLTWKNDQIPQELVKWVKRWKDTNPDWEVWFWTDESSKSFITKKYEYLLKVYERYRTGIFRADAMRYIVLYEYGGIWADLDIEPLKSLEPVRDTYPCILSQESEVHARMGWHVPFMVCNAFMATRARHPFFKFLIEMLEINQKDNHPVAATGPIMITRMYKAYKPLYEKIGTKTPWNKVFISPVNMFLPTTDTLALENLQKRCRSSQISGENQYLCDKYLSPTFQNGPTNESFTDHHWWHSWFGNKDWRVFVPINDVLPDVIFPEKAGKF